MTRLTPNDCLLKSKTASHRYRTIVLRVNCHAATKIFTALFLAHFLSFHNIIPLSQNKASIVLTIRISTKSTIDKASSSEQQNKINLMNLIMLINSLHYLPKRLFSESLLGKCKRTEIIINTNKCKSILQTPVFTLCTINASRLF